MLINSFASLITFIIHLNVHSSGSLKKNTHKIQGNMFEKNCDECSLPFNSLIACSFVYLLIISPSKVLKRNQKKSRALIWKCSFMLILLAIVPPNIKTYFSHHVNFNRRLLRLEIFIIMNYSAPNK